MSNVALSGNASGTGTFTIASPNSNTDRTLSLPDASGTILTTATPGVPVNGPAFSARSSATTSISAATWTKLAFASEDFDTNSNYNNTGSTVGSTPAYAFLPTIAGYYQFSAAAILNNTTSTGAFSFYKNGTAVSVTQSNTGGVGILSAVGGSTLIYLNGSTDYVELYIIIGAPASLAGQSPATFFQAFLARSAT